MPWIAACAAAAVSLVGLEMLWLGLIARGLYQRAFGEMLLERPNWVAAAGFYTVFVAGIVFLAVRPADSWKAAALNGAALGLVAYATYDLTNLATLRDFPARVVIPDLLWGTFVAAAASGAGWLAASRFS